MSRTVCWFSCGAASAAATKITLDHAQSPVSIAYCDTGSEHPDNWRFLADCEEWFGQKIEVLKSHNFKDVWDVWEGTGWLIGPKGARCTAELKKKLRHQYQEVDDIQIFGYTAEERKRAMDFQADHPELTLKFPLIEGGVSKAKCKRLIRDAGIELPKMYQLGYRNNNCIGCVKGGMGYWNKVRVDFPETFARMARLERKLNVAVCKSYAGDKKRKRVFLDELPPNAGRYESEPDMSCGFTCTQTEFGFDEDHSALAGEKGLS